MKTKSLSTLLRLAQTEIDARQEALAAAVERRMALEAQDRALTDALAAERARGTAEGFGAFALRTRKARATLALRINEAVAYEEALRDEMREAFRARKTLEHVFDRRQEAEAREEARRDAQALDETAARAQHFRR